MGVPRVFFYIYPMFVRKKKNKSGVISVQVIDKSSGRYKVKKILKQLVIYRLTFPKSKLKTTEYLKRYNNINWSEDKIYHYLDKLYKEQKKNSNRLVMLTL